MVHRKPHMLFVSQKVTDIKLPLDLEDLAQTMGDLREYLHKYSFLPPRIDKFTGELTTFNIDKQGNLSCELIGSSLGSPTPRVRPAIHLTLPLGLTDYNKELRIQDIFGAVSRTSIDDGGNIQNMLIDTLVLIEAISREYPSFDSNNLLITVASSSHPFQRLNNETAAHFQQRVEIYPLEIPDRFAIHFPYEQAGRHGIMPITSEPKETYGSLLALLGNNAQFGRLFRSATCFISSDSFFQIFPNHAMAPYAYVINASTALRGQVAISAYGNNALLPMNKEEAGEVCKLMLSRARGTELDKTETPKFPSPLTTDTGIIDPGALEILDNSIDLFSRHNPFFQQAEGFSFACPISFGSDGGLIIGMNKEPIACFTSILSDNGEQSLFDQYTFPKSEQIQETGAGDSVAAIVALFNTVSPEMILVPYLRGNEKKNRDLQHLASTIFVSCLSRLAGNLLIRTPLTNMANIKTDSLGSLIDDVAVESVNLARNCVKLLPEPTFGVIEKWGIKVVVWVPRRVFIPTGATVTIK